MLLVCKRLSATDETLEFLSPFIGQEHIQRGINDEWRTPFGMYTLLHDIRSEKLRCYGVFELDGTGNVRRFCGFEAGELDLSGHGFEHHAFWARHVPVKICLDLCRELVTKEYAAVGIDVTSFVCFLPECNRAVRQLAFRYGCRDCGLTPNRVFWKDGKKYPCRMFKFERTVEK